MEVKYVDHMGTDLSVVNAARVSFSKKSDWEFDIVDGPQYAQPKLYDRDANLIAFLARGCTSGDWDSLLEKALECGQQVQASSNCMVQDDAMLVYDESLEDMTSLLQHIKNMPTHWTPFGHTSITVHVKAPIFVARQLGKHQTGFVWNEVSRRYVTEEPEFYRPVWRMKAENVKQGSGPEFGVAEQFYLNGGEDYVEMMSNFYQWLLDEGVCAEQARMVLPQSMYTEWYWTGNLYAFANMFIQRTDSHAQKEVQEVAHKIGKIIKPLYPVSWRELTRG